MGGDIVACFKHSRSAAETDKNLVDKTMYVVNIVKQRVVYKRLGIFC